MLDTVTENTTIAELCANKELTQISDDLFTHMTDDVWHNTIAHYDNKKCEIIPALKRVAEITAAGETIIHHVYPQAQIDLQPELGDVAVIHMPGETDKPFVLVCPGGGYAREWVLVEGYPIAARLNRMGYTAFILIYRTGQTGLLPKPMEDVAQALRFIKTNRSRFRVSDANYAVAGFSAGGHLAAEWGTKDAGYAKYGLNKPGALFLGYPAVSNDIFYDSLQANPNPVFQTSIRNYLERVGGQRFTKEVLRQYSIEYHMDDAYPATYLIHCQDDPVVPIASSRVMDDRLRQYGIPHLTRFPEDGGHSFGVGNHTGSDGWLEQAVTFWEKIRE